MWGSPGAPKTEVTNSMCSSRRRSRCYIYIYIYIHTYDCIYIYIYIQLCVYVRPLDMIQKRSEKCAAASYALTLKPLTLERRGGPRGRMPFELCARRRSRSPPPSDSAPRPVGLLRSRAGGIPRVAPGRAACPAQVRLPRGHGAGGAQCSRVESRRDSLLAAQPAVRSAEAVVHFTDRGQQPTPLVRATWGSVRGACS